MKLLIVNYYVIKYINRYKKICGGLSHIITLKKCLYIVVCIALLLSACGYYKHNDGTENKGPINSDKNISNSETITLDWYINENWYNKKWDVNATLFDRVVTEKTGVKINVITPTGDGDTKLTAMAVSDELPDIVTINNWDGIRNQMIKGGYFLSLEDLSKKYAPDLLNIIPQSMIKWLVQQDGEWYAIVNDFIAPERMPKGYKIDNANGIIARKDIMTDLGIKPSDFYTQEGTIAALTKVKNAKIQNGDSQIIPLCIQWNDWVLARMWGIPWEKADGSWQDFIMSDKYVEIYKFLNKLWRTNLIDKDTFTVWPGNRIKDGSCFAYIGNMDDIYQPLIAANKDGIIYVPVGPIHALDGSQPIFDQAGTGWMSTFITENCSYPDKAIRLLSFLSSDEGQMLTWYGVEGQTYKLKNNKVIYTDRYLEMLSNQPDLANKVYGIKSFFPIRQMLFNKKMLDADSLPKEEKDFNAINDYFSQFAVLTPETMYTWPDKGTPEAAIKQRIDDYWNEQTRYMVMADSEEGVERIYKEAIEEIKKLGYDKVYAVTNAKFQAQKKADGKKFSFSLNR